MMRIVLTTVALIAAGGAQAQTMSGPTTSPSAPGSAATNPTGVNPSAPAPVEQMSPSTSGMTGPSATDTMTEKMARDKLSGAGYGSVSSLKRNANGEWEAVTKKGSKQQRVTVAADGTVSPQAPM